MSVADPPTAGGLNVTIDPSSRATAVDNPEIVDVIDLTTGRIKGTTEVITSLRYDAFVAERVRVKEALKQDKPIYACALCGTPVYLVASPLKRFFFRHDREDGSCPAQTRSPLSEEQIRARKYHGLRESEAHKRIKHLITRSLRADPTFEAQSIRSESRWRALHDDKLWRQPDVQAQCARGRFAFEAQLSTTFLDVVVSRRSFYREEKAILVWILGQFSPDERRMTTDDLLFSNNSNVFVIDEETARISEETHRFQLRCHFRRPALQGEIIVTTWDDALVSFHDLTADIDRQRIFYFDHEGEERRLRDGVDERLREEFITFWLQATRLYLDEKAETMDWWSSLKTRFEARGIGLPKYPDGDAGFRSLIHGILSAIEGAPVGWKFESLVQVAHQLAEQHPENLIAFGYALKHAGHEGLLESQDMTGKWRRRREEVRSRIQARDRACMPNPQWLPALSFLFPKIGTSVVSFIERNDGRYRVPTTCYPMV